MSRVFTFWEPKGDMPGYIRLCLKTWARCLPGRDIVVLDYSSLNDWLTCEERMAITCREEALAQQADCVRCAVLNKHGGIWLDADTILTRPLDGRFMSSEVTMVARREDRQLVNYGAYIYAAHPETRIISEWYRQLLPRIRKSRQFRTSMLKRILHHREWKDVRGWGYFENAILDPLTTAANAADYSWVDKDAVGAFPEETLPEAAANPFDAYVHYWFSSGDPSSAMDGCAGMIMLHNSWTPTSFRRMSAGDFLATDTRLAALLRRLLGGRQEDREGEVSDGI